MPQEQEQKKETRPPREGRGPQGAPHGPSPRGDRPGGDRPGGDRPGGDRPGGDRGDRGDRRGFDRGRMEGPPEIVAGMVMYVITSFSVRPASRARNPPMD